MKKVIGGLIAIILGVFCLTIFFPNFLNFMAGIIPLFFILGGCLIIFLNYEDGMDSWNKNDITDVSSPMAPAETAPAESESVETEPEKTEPKVAEPVETEPVEPEPVEPEPVEPEPVEPEPDKTKSDEKIIEKTTDDIPQLLGNTDSRVFHSPDCQYSKGKKCTAVFSTREEAIQEGYKPCGVCKP